MTKQSSIRNAMPGDLDAVIDLDQLGPEEEKSDYWADMFYRYVNSGRKDRLFLVAEMDDTVIGFITGEIRAWEFGSPPCGWVSTLAVSDKVRESGVGQQMLEEMCKRFKLAGINTVRTMVARDNKMVLAFFRSQGMRTGLYIELEKQID